MPNPQADIYKPGNEPTTMLDQYEQISEIVTNMVEGGFNAECGLQFISTDGYPVNPRTAISSIFQTGGPIFVGPRLNDAGNRSLELIKISPDPISGGFKAENLTAEEYNIAKTVLPENTTVDSYEVGAMIHNESINNRRFLKGRNAQELDPELRTQLQVRDMLKTMPENVDLAAELKTLADGLPENPVTAQLSAASERLKSGGMETMPQEASLIQQAIRGAAKDNDLSRKFKPIEEYLTQRVDQINKYPQRNVQARQEMINRSLNAQQPYVDGTDAAVKDMLKTNPENANYGEEIQRLADTLKDLPESNPVRQRLQAAGERAFMGQIMNIDTATTMDLMAETARQLQTDVAQFSNDPILSARLKPVSDYANERIANIENYPQRKAEEAQRAEEAGRKAQQELDARNQQRRSDSFRRQVNGMAKTQVQNFSQARAEISTLKMNVPDSTRVPDAISLESALKLSDYDLTASRNATGDALNEIVEANALRLQRAASGITRYSADTAPPQLVESANQIMRYASGKFAQCFDRMASKPVESAQQLAQDMGKMRDYISGQPGYEAIEQQLIRNINQLDAAPQTSGAELQDLAGRQAAELGKVCRDLQKMPGSDPLSDPAAIINRYASRRTAQYEATVQERLDAQTKLNPEQQARQRLSDMAVETQGKLQSLTGKTGPEVRTQVRELFSRMISLKRADNMIAQNSGEFDPEILETITSEASIELTSQAIMANPDMLSMAVTTAGIEGRADVLESVDPLQSEGLAKMTESFTRGYNGDMVKDAVNDITKLGNKLDAANNSLGREILSGSNITPIQQFKGELFARAEIVMGKFNSANSPVEAYRNMMQNPVELQTLIMADIMTQPTVDGFGLGTANGVDGQLTNVGYPECLKAIAESPVYKSAMEAGTPEAIHEMLSDPMKVSELKLDVANAAPKMEAKVPEEMRPVKPVEAPAVHAI